MKNLVEYLVEKQEDDSKVCPKCGKNPCECDKHEEGDKKDEKDDEGKKKEDEGDKGEE